ncbi:hypothetical protein JavanS412_0010 [Streptococcus satellite phage Javan412]|uniref:hypothetical protein n=1 Tax=Streptococcus parauberis TaxID=1348 RepID=UPI000976D7E0|nr:hypothetical protein [Streptococcus parauberis]ONH63082.1 hypothetical protein ASN87_01547 [Streptococcus parauberis]PCH13453.1 hypothetical protein A9Y58_00696 [Streptococcus parauberis]QBX10134.1 hypothetical protein JavanS412_0010 [Streptococcus satellite phage Javan412]
MKIKTFYQDFYETNEGLDARVNQFMESVKVLDVMTDATSCGSSERFITRITVSVLYEEKNPFNNNLVSKKY